MKKNYPLKRSHLLLLSLLLFCINSSFAQTDIKVTGSVSDETGMGLPGVSVTEKGTFNGAITDVDGKFSLSVKNASSVLLVSFVGYNAKEITVGNQNNFDISLDQDVASLEEVVVVGYGTQKKVTVTGAVAQLQGKSLIKSPSVDLSNSLSGRLPGLVVIQQSGEPGNDGATISIRGTNTLGNNSPLIVIDGIPDRDGGLGRLNPRDIESMSVLKDASAAIYGARAANGAIIITTKRGTSGKPKVTYDFNQGWSQPTFVPQMSNAFEYANIMNELPIYKTIPVNEWANAWNSIKTTGSYDSPTEGISSLNANYSPDAVAKHKNGTDAWGYPDTDWFADTFRKWSPQKRHNLSISGGTEAVRYFSSFGYVFQDAIYKNSATNFSQYNFRTNVDAKINKYISTSVGIMVRREERNYPTQSSGSIFRMLMRGRPTEPAVWPNGMPGPDIENGQNPVVITTDATGYVRTPIDYTQANGSVIIANPWVDGLKLTLSASIDKNNQTAKRWETPWMLYYWDKASYEADGVTPLLEGAVRSNFTDPRLTQGSSSELNTNMSAMLSYDVSLSSKHNLGFLAGVTKEKFTGEGFSAFRRNYISAAVDQLFAGGATQNVTGSAYVRPRLGYYGRAQYNYDEKYMLELIGRYDGSYIFPKAGRFGFFPGILAGWNVSNESFFNVPAVDYLKLRASFGQMGNDQVFFNNQLQEFAYLSTYGFGQYPIDGKVVTTLNETVLANPNFTWERANNFNFGIDGTFLNSFLDVTLEYFFNRRDQILIQKTGSTPASSGISSLLPPVNAGKVDNRGFEFNIGINGKPANALQWRASLNGGYAKNKVIFMDEVPGAEDYQLQEGKPIGAFLVYESDGVFKDEAAIEANTLDYSGVTSKLLPGDMKFKDVNGDGIIDGKDQVRIDKNTVPTLNYGAMLDLGYKNFDLSLLFQGASGAAMRIYTESGDIGNFLKYSNDNRWSIDNPSAEHPRLASRGDTYYTGGNFGNNTYYLFDKDYLRLKNIELGYNLPNAILDRAKISNFRVFVNALNLFTINKYKIFDPEATNTAGTNYPLSRVINTGLSLTF